MHSLKSKILLLSIIPLIITIIVISAIYLTNFINSNNMMIERNEYDLIRDKQQLVKNQIISATAIIDSMLQKSNKIDEVKKEIVSLFLDVRFLENKSGYFYAYEEKEGHIYMAFNSKKKHLNGQKININKLDAKGFAFRKALIESGNKNKFITYYSKKPNTDKFQKKIAFAQHIEKLNWTIGTGIYIDDVNEQVNQMKQFAADNLRTMVIKTLISSLVLLIASSLLILFIVNMSITKPLSIFQQGINSFFDYLGDSKKEIKKIDIHSSDEIGQMTTSVNSSIEVSVKIHAEIANLMKIMDKNIITIKSDGKGIIIYVSRAFCKVTGYQASELIGKEQKYFRHPDVEQKIFTDIRLALLNDKEWRGEIKSMTKSGATYWVDTIVTPDYDSANNLIGSSSVCQDITAQKVVEDLTTNLEVKIEERTADLDIAKKQIEATHKHTRESIEYAALIQGALLPEEQLFSGYFKDSFTSWIPKDTVGGDIYLFNQLRHPDECLLMFIDCTGHGVPGAFVTMLVKAVEAQIIAEIMNSPEMDISPAWVMSFFNKSLKKLLRQESVDSVSNAGWDGGIIYYNRSTQILKFAGAETPLFYVDIEGDFHTIKGNRYSVGYKKCAMDYQYKESTLDVKEGMKFYCTTDGYIDQNGGKRDYPFGKKRFANIIKENHMLAMSVQQDIFVTEISKYEKQQTNNDRNDDMTVIGFVIDKCSESIQSKRIDIVKYDGIITQNVISACMDNIESNISNLSMMSKLSTLVVELCQNMMNYSKTILEGCREIQPAGYIRVTRNEKRKYYVQSKNIISLEDKEKIEATLIEIKKLDANEIKKAYRELRRSGKNSHAKGGGIGFYEIAKLVSHIDYQFSMINAEKYYFKFEVVAEAMKKKSI